MNDSIDQVPDQEILELVQDIVQMSISGTDTDLFETGTLDSLAMVDLVTRLEQRYGFQIPLDALDVDAFRTPARIAAFVRRHQG